MPNNRATRITASTLGILVGLAGIDHGIFEILQGNVRPDGIMIEAIGPSQRFWEYGTETALTILPSFLISGILSVILGIAVVIWAGWFVDRKGGAAILMALSILLFLVGGGFAPIFMALIASLTATRIHASLSTWRRLMPGVVGRFLGAIWLLVLVIFVFVFVISVVIAIFGWPLTAFFDARTAFDYLNSMALGMVLLMVLSAITAFARDIQVKNTKQLQ
jgi:hypothetical protein